MLKIQRAMLRATFTKRTSFCRSFTSENGAEAKAHPGDGEAKSAIDILNEKLAQKEKEIAELKNLYVRALADAENVRNRTKKELADNKDFAIQKFAKDLLTTADILTMALAAVPEKERGEDASHPDLKNLYIGVDMTRKELLKTLESYGVTSFDPMGHEFDFNKHSALFQSPMPNMKPGTVFHVDKVGYMIKDRVLRPAHVGVVKDSE